MNARQIKKNLKKEICRLKSDNDLMRRIISDSPQMQELYDLYNKPLNVTHSTIDFQKCEAKIALSQDGEYVDDGGFAKGVLAKKLFEKLRDNIVYEIDRTDSMPIMTASIYVGRK